MEEERGITKLDSKSLKAIKKFLDSKEGTELLGIIKQMFDREVDDVWRMQLVSNELVQAAMMRKGYALGLEWFLNLGENVNGELEFRAKELAEEK